MTKYSLSKHSADFETYSDKMRRMFPGYYLTADLALMPGAAPTINLIELKALLLSKNIDKAMQSNLARLAFRGDSIFLDDFNIDGERVCFASYPRSGSSLLRKYIELVTGSVTGSDMALWASLHL